MLVRSINGAGKLSTVKSNTNIDFYPCAQPRTLPNFASCGGDLYLLLSTLLNRRRSGVKVECVVYGSNAVLEAWLHSGGWVTVC